MQTAVRAGRARVEAVLAAQALRDAAAAEDVPEATGEGPQLRRSVPAVGSAAAAGLRPISDTVRSTYGGGTARAGRVAAPAAAPLGMPAQAPVSLIGTLSTDEGAVRGHRNAAPAPAAAVTELPEVVVEQETVVVAPAEAAPAAMRTAQKVQPVVVRASVLVTSLHVASSQPHACRASCTRLHALSGFRVTSQLLVANWCLAL